MKTTILLLILTVKIYSQSGLNFKSEFTTPNSFSGMSNGSIKTSKENNYDRMMNVIFNGGQKTSINPGCYVTRTSTDSNKRHILVKQYFQQNNTTVELEKTETLVSINEKF